MSTRRVFRQSFILSLVLLSRSWVHGAEPTGLEMREVEPTLTEDVLFNPDMGEYLDGRKGLEFVDIGGIGEWGEMHLGLHIQGRWTPQQLEETGFTRDKYVAAYRRVIDARAAAFPRSNGSVSENRIDRW